MRQPLALADYQIRLFHAVLETHDFLWFASYDVSNIASTEVVIHNYALCYALSRFERGIVFEQIPTYMEDLAQMPLYATPADLILCDNPFAGKVKQTWNALDSRTHRTEDPRHKKVNTPKIGKRIVVAPLTRFTFYIFTFQSQRPPGAIRLGKKRVPCRVHYTEIPHPTAKQYPYLSPTHLVNPLDVQGQVAAFNPINIPPHLLLRHARIEDDYIVTHKDKRDYHAVHIPKRVLARMDAA
jgi:CRISPR-associated protein Csc1